jgi:hypothetical protein
VVVSFRSCDKTPEAGNLREKKVVLAPGFSPCPAGSTAEGSGGQKDHGGREAERESLGTPRLVHPALNPWVGPGTSQQRHQLGPSI